MRAWIVGGAAAAALLAVVVSVSALRPLDPYEQPGRPVELPYRLMSGGICDLDLEVRVLGTADPSAAEVAERAVSSMSAPTERPAGVSIDDELAAFVDRLAEHAEHSVGIATGNRVDVALDASWFCAGPRVARVVVLDPVDPDDDRLPDLSGFPPDLTVVFAASTGALCAVTVAVQPDYASGAGEEEVVTARTWLAAVDLRGMDPVTLVSEQDQLFALGYSQAGPTAEQLEAHAVTRFLFDGAFDASVEADRSRLQGSAEVECYP